MWMEIKAINQAIHLQRHPSLLHEKDMDCKGGLLKQRTVYKHINIASLNNTHAIANIGSLSLTGWIFTPPNTNIYTYHTHCQA